MQLADGSANSRYRQKRRRVVVVERVAGVHAEAIIAGFDGILQGADCGGERGVGGHAVDQVAATRGKGVGKDAGMELDRVEAARSGGIDLATVGRDECAGHDPRGLERREIQLPVVLASRDGEAALGGHFLATLGNERHLMGLDPLRDRLHLGGAGHLEVELHRAGLADQFDIAIDDVTTVFAEMNGDALGPAEDRGVGGVHGIGLAIPGGSAGAGAVAGLTDGRDVVDVDTEVDHVGLLAVPGRAAGPVPTARRGTPTAVRRGIDGASRIPSHSMSPLRRYLASRRPDATIGQVLFYGLVRTVAALLFVLFYRVRVFGAKNVPQSGAVLIAANHQSFLDPPLIGSFARPRHMSFVAKIGLFTFKPFAWFIGALNATPIKEEGGDAAAIKEVIRRLGAGHAVVIFPEGSRTPDGRQHAFKRGVAVLMKRAKCPVVPAAVVGCYEAWPIQQKMPSLVGHRILVAYGEPISHEDLLREGADAALARIEREVTRLRVALEAERDRD